MLQIEPSTLNGRLVLKLQGELTIYEVAEAKAEIEARLEAAPHVDLDLGGVESIDTAGVQLLHWLKQEARVHPREILYLHHSPAVIEVLDLLNLTATFGDPILIVPRS